MIGFIGPRRPDLLHLLFLVWFGLVSDPHTISDTSIWTHIV